MLLWAPQQLTPDLVWGEYIQEAPTRPMSAPLGPCLHLSHFQSHMGHPGSAPLRNLQGLRAPFGKLSLQVFTVKLSLSCFSAVRKVGRTQASSNSWKMGARVSHQDWLPGTLALRQGSRQKLGLFIFPKGLCRPCPTFSSEERAISGVAYCIF